MQNSEYNFDKFTHEANEYFNGLAENLGRPEESNRLIIVWKAVMHTIRDRIHMGENFDLMSQLPMILKGMFVEGWKFNDKPPLDYETVDDMNSQIEKLQKRYGEEDFNWSHSTDGITALVLNSLRNYVSEGQLEHIQNQLPKPVQNLMPVN